MILLRQRDILGTPPIETPPATEDESYTVGEALVVTDGAVTLYTGTGAPVYICAGNVIKAAAGGTVPCYRVQKTQIYDAELTEDGSALKIGDKVTISADGLGITATTGGPAEITAIDGTKPGDRIGVRF